MSSELKIVVEISPLVLIRLKIVVKVSPLVTHSVPTLILGLQNALIIAAAGIWNAPAAFPDQEHFELCFSDQEYFELCFPDQEHFVLFF